MKGAAVSAVIACAISIPTAAQQPTIPIEPLAAYDKLDGNSVTVSGISAGAFFAHQFHVAYSGLVKGAGLVAGGPYACAEQVDAIDPPFGNPLILGLIPRRVVAALAVCTHFARSDFKQAGWNFPAKPDPNDSRKTALRAHAQGRIDDPPTSPPPAPGSSTATATATYQSPPSRRSGRSTS